MHLSPLPLATVAALSFSTMACHHPHHVSEEDPRYLVTSPLRQDTEVTTDYVAQLRAIQHIELRALEKGYVQGIFVDEGQKVAAGARMFQIMPLVYQAEVHRAQAEAEVSAIELRNTKTLADKSVVSANELSLVNAKLNKAKAEVALTSAHQSLTDIRAPFGGIMGPFEARLGSLVDEGDLLTTLSDNSTIWAYFNVTETDYLKYKATKKDDAPTPVKLVMANGQTFDQPGKVDTIEADFDNATGNLAFRASFPNPAGILRHGETGKILMTVSMKNALLIPQMATFNVLDKKFVFVVDENDVVHSRRITIRAELPNIFVVESGLDEKDKILVEGLRKVKEGSKIGADFKPPTYLLSHLEVPAE